LRRETPYLRARPLRELWTEYLHLLDHRPSGRGRRRLSIDQARRERWRRLALSCGAALSPGEAADLSQRYRSLYQRSRRPVAGARELLERLHRRASVVVVTNNEVAEQEEKLRFLGIGPWVDGLVVSEAIGTAKPDRLIFDVALSAGDATPAEAVMLGDSWTSDVEGARRAGIRAVWFNRFGKVPLSRLSVPELRSLRPSAPAQRLLLHGDANPRPGLPNGAGVIQTGRLVP
jgi:HAD superfamily hydrolase (TIGR01549 family)